MKIAFVGASGYGNVGDNTYPVVFSQYLPQHELIFFNSDLPPRMPSGLGLLVLGGGGILYNNPDGPDLSEPSPHFCQMRFYMEWAMSRKVPWGITSCGFQFRRGTEERIAEVLHPWVPYLQKARFITLRSPNCVRIAQELGGREDVQFYPDAGYLLRHSGAETPVTPRNVLTIVMAGQACPGDIFTERMIRFCKSMQYEIAWMSMGAPVDDDYNLGVIRRDHPGETIIEQPTPEQALRQIASSRMVITGRFHGMVFARASGVPFHFPEDVPYKLLQEDFGTPAEAAFGHIRVLKQTIAALESRT